jgi:hypothetical protein
LIAADAAEIAVAVVVTEAVTGVAADHAVTAVAADRAGGSAALTVNAARALLKDRQDRFQR